MLSLLLASLLLGFTPQGDPKPNILVILADDVGWRDIDASIPTPNIDRLASQGLSMTRAYAEPYCSPARFALLFGLNPWRELLGTYIQPYLAGEVTTRPGRVSIAEHLRNSGWATGAFGKWHVSTVAAGFPASLDWPRQFGFDTFQAGRLDNLGFMSDYTNWPRIDDGRQVWTTEYNTTAISRAASDWWRATAGPKFAYVAFHAGHGPWHVPPAQLLPPGYRVGPSNREKFEAAVVAMDTEIGRLLSVVDLRDTLIVFTSDNGTPVPARDQIPSHLKGSVFEGGVRVPLILAGPGVPPGTSSDSLVRLTDLYATFCDYARIQRVSLPDAQDSVSFFRVFTQRNYKPRVWVYTSEFAPNGAGPYSQLSRAAISQRYKLIDRGGLESLYDVIADPQELHPIPPSSLPRVYAILRHRMDGQIAQGAP